MRVPPHPRKAQPSRAERRQARGTDPAAGSRPDAPAGWRGAGEGRRAGAGTPGVVLRPLAPGDEPELRRIHAEPEVVRWWDAPDERFPWDEPDVTRWTILVDGTIAGLIQAWEEDDPKYRHAGIDLFVDPALRGRGIGPEAIRQVARHLVEARGHHRITIDPAADNAAAIRAYEKVGFRPVGIMRRYERDSDGDGWHDGLLMELVAEDDGA